ncbi:MAG TPA: type I polyketide synthase, partial [Polyangiaceae bacterium]|nr:type I polyketide synthase [Polyangiaceae bacterium]
MTSDTKWKRATVAQETSGQIAVVGMSCRFPGGAVNLNRYWDVLASGTNAAAIVPPERWDADAYYDPRPGTRGKLISKHGAFLEDVFGFDTRFFGIAAREAMSMDPQQRLLLELGWEVLEHAGVVLRDARLERCGVFTGIMNNDYARMHLMQRGLRDIDAYHLTGNWFSFFAGRLAYTLGIRGPAVAVDAACASSLVAVHLAIQSLRRGECDLALAGAVSLILSPELSLVLSSAGALSPDGLSKAFDQRADGMGRGEGGGLVALKRLEDALADGDEIWAVLRGSAVNHCGAGPGFTVPSMRAQEELIRTALGDAGVAAKDVEYVEAHGTGTKVGDPIEAQAIGSVYREHRAGRLLIGSAKTNLGHLDAAAGMAGLIKTILALDHERLPPHLHFTGWNPEIDADALQLEIPTQITPWLRRPEQDRLAAVSAFGMSGMNAHVVVQGPPFARGSRTRAGASPSAVDRQPSPGQAQATVLPISARCEEALRALAEKYRGQLSGETDDGIARLVAGAALKRAPLRHRLAVIGKPAELADGLTAAIERVALGRAEPPERAEPIVFVFSGQGEQWPSMGRALRQSSLAFREALKRCDELFLDRLGWSVESVLDGDDSVDLRETLTAQPVVFALQYALAAAWQSLGISPAAVVGHSLGEVAAACVAGR